ncbi:MAG: biotin--[acetyl-CoA-carboxylase] ligase [Clostridia bacterium]|nr:biotin--[acetyl-CoA-carboxylase] ligase [Clostridia bacterium]
MIPENYHTLTRIYDVPVYSAPLTASTNFDAKIAAGSGEGEAIFLAEEQTAGRGRLGRSFFSPGGGIYLSFLLRPEMKAEEIPRLTTLAAVAVSEAIEEVAGCAPGIKWVNDVYIAGKKAVGILNEAGFSPDGGVSWVVTGIGINAYAPKGGFPEELADIAAAVWPEDNGRKNELTEEVIRRFLSYYRSLDFKSIHEKYKKRCFVPGKDIFVLRNGERFPARALDIDEENHLLVRYPDGREEALATGEVSIRLQ